MSQGDYLRGSDPFSRKVADVIDQVSFINGNTSTTSTDAYSITTSILIPGSTTPALNRLVDGETFHFISNRTNTTTTPTLNVDTIGAKTMLRYDGSAIVIGDIVNGGVYAARYNTSADKFYILGAGYAPSASVPTLTSGTYTPTLTNVANLDTVTAIPCQYLRVGSVVTVSGGIAIDPTLAATATEVGISIPIASNFGAAEDCAGVAFAPSVAGQGAAILADFTNDRAAMRWISTDITNQAMYFSFTYRII